MNEALPTGVSSLTRPFWDAARESILVRPVCNQCGLNFFAPQLACPKCYSESWSYQPSSGSGVVETFTVVHRAPTGEREPPYIVAVVALEERWRMMTNIVNCAPDAPRIGDPVSVCFEKLKNGVTVPVFELVKQERS
ncbi:Zn-ribbon domain-containing OB-fold protein [Hyphococcus sp.]|uniref:Zn-ribbon domain-containing OB-fold protein n=1 Tax=Hyphococcus sp. TaxID=2038636 RepID=UPI003CCB8844